jgi:ATP-dependent exoDNAse (exonuclease V) beta subunit
MISRAVMVRYYILAKGDEHAENASLISKNLIEASKVYFPEGYQEFLEKVKQLPLFEAIESIIGFFRLGDYSFNVAYLNTFQDFIISFTGNKNSDIQSFLDWWESTGTKKSVVLPENQDATRILTIHKSKGLEFRVVILPFLSWDLDHLPSKQPVLWVRPPEEPFNELGIVPVRYSKDLTGTIFSDYYKNEKYSVYLDNINLLYVAFTRAQDVIYGFSVSNPRSENSIAATLFNAITSETGMSETSGFKPADFYNSETRVFKFGEVPEHKKDTVDNLSLSSSEYKVSQTMESLKLKLHGENYFSSENLELRKKINYGKLMHEVFEGIDTSSDISFAIRKLVLEGKLPEEESAAIESRVNLLIKTPEVAEWFATGNVVLKEAGILLRTGNTRRPDRVIIKDGKAIVIDFKFGGENNLYIEQVNLYRSLLADMGYKNIKAYIWYVDKNKIVSA